MAWPRFEHWTLKLTCDIGLLLRALMSCNVPCLQTVKTYISQLLPEHIELYLKSPSPGLLLSNQAFQKPVAFTFTSQVHH